MNRSIFTFALLFVCVSLTAQTVSKDAYRFKPVHEVQCTDVKSQGQTGTCWSFSTVSFLESEVAKESGKLVDLSDMFPVWHTYLAKAQKYLRYQGKVNFSQGSLSHDVIDVLKNHGAVPETAFVGKKDGKGSFNHTALEKELKAFLDKCIKEKSVPKDWKTQFENIMETHMGRPLDKFEYEGTTYNPRTFADKFLGLRATAYTSYASFTHHPFGSPFVLEVPDNFSDGQFYNIPMKKLTTIVDNALRNGYTVAWDCDVSERGFSAQQGLAILPAEETAETTKADMNKFFSKPHSQMVVTEEMRQAEFDTYELTDDHLMQIVGMSKDQAGNDYYVVKNSWGEIGPFKGYIYVTKAYFDMNTISVVVNRKAVPKGIHNPPSRIGAQNKPSINNSMRDNKRIELEQKHKLKKAGQ